MGKNSDVFWWRDLRIDSELLEVHRYIDADSDQLNQSKIIENDDDDVRVHNFLNSFLKIYHYL